MPHPSSLEDLMAKYLVKVSYTADGARGLVKEGGTARRDAATRLIESVGGKVESFYFAFGVSDAYLFVDMPDHASALAASLAVNASGAVTTETVVLLTPEEVDKACQSSPAYRAPGA
jgi:uncharacterized protein with GYD domain